jgi:magnesium transporter
MEQAVHPSGITVFDFDEGTFSETELKNITECHLYKDKSTFSWINIDGIEDKESIEQIGQIFNIHPLVVEDILIKGQRPKMEEFPNLIFVSLQMLIYQEKEGTVDSEQVSFVLGERFILTFQEDIPGDVFDPIRNRIRVGKAKIRSAGIDYLLYSLIQSVIDHYFGILEKLGDKIEDLEATVMDDASMWNLKLIYRLKRDIITLRKSVWPLRELLNQITRSESELFQRKNKIYFRDLYDHTIEIIDSIEVNRDILTSLLDIHLSSMSYKMNNVMKVLTVISTIFIPLTFITSIYGMNFTFMPELKWKYGYAFVWGIMLFCVFWMFYFFRKRKWF